MLFFSNHQIVFDFELGKEQSYIGDSCAFCHSQDAPNFFPNLEIKDIICTDDIKEGVKCALSPEAYLNFVREWHDDCSFHKLYLWTPEEWFRSYYNTIRYAIFSLDGDIGHDEPVFPELTLEIVKRRKIKYNVNRRIVVFNNKPEPEFSWALEDCIWQRIHGKNDFPYALFVNRIINRNQTINTEYARRLHLFERKKKIQDRILDIRTIVPDDLTLSALHSPYPGDRIRTNIHHLIKILKIFHESG